MTKQLLTIREAKSYFNDGCYIEIPSERNRFDDLLGYLSVKKIIWEFYTIINDDIQQQGIHLTFQDKSYIEAEPIILKICRMLGVRYYCLCEGRTQTVIDIEGDVVAFADFSEEQDNELPI